MRQEAPMSGFATKRLPEKPDVAAPDGSQVRILLRLDGGSMAHFELAPGTASIPVAHRTVEELWYVLGGQGEMWRRDAEGEEVVEIVAGVSLSIPLGTEFQFRSTGDEALTAVAITMPPWPGEDEAYVVEGKWEPKTSPPSPLSDFGEGEEIPPHRPL
jgi:mannose-6-phosphate isomerase-like protein (cupin superfamily)